MATSGGSTKPKDLDFDDTLVDICFHPSKDVIASGTMDGDVFLHSYSCSADNSELMHFTHHKKACRTLKFSGSGEELHTASKDKSIQSIDLNTGTLKRDLQKAHDSAIYSMAVSGEHFLATGDDDGHIKLWDLRTQTAVMDLRHNEEFISDMVIDSQCKTLLATSGDGTLTAVNVRRKRMELQSELFDSEFLSVAIVKQGQKVVCGCGEGELNIFNWGEWGNMSDRFPGHPLSVDSIIPLTENIICTGSSDGMIRAVNIQPNKFIGVIGEHSDDLPIENLSLSRDKRFLASCSHDQKVKFWDVQDVKKEKVKHGKKANKKDKSKPLKSSTKSSDFFAGFADGTEEKKDEEKDEESDDEDDDESDEDSDSD